MGNESRRPRAAPHADVVHGGRYYARLAPEGRLVPVGDYDGEADLWICRRVADFPDQQVPRGAGRAACARCGVPIVFHPRRTIAAPKVCMPCADIVPLPIE